MPLISHGSFDAFRASARGVAETEYGVTGPQSFSVLRELTRAVQPVPVTFERRDGSFNASVTAIDLNPSSRGMLRRVLDASADVHVLAWCWDLSGAPVMVCPDVDGSASEQWRLVLTGDQRRLADPLPLWSERPLVGGLCLRVILWQGDYKQVPEAVAEAMRHSRLDSVLATLGGAAETTITSAVMVREAAGGLGTDIAPVLRAFCPDYIDFFEGYFPVPSRRSDTVAETVHEADQGRLVLRRSA